MKSIFLSFVAVILFAQTGSAAIFGVDNRTDLTPSSPYQVLARATAVAVLSANYAVNDKGTIDLAVDPLSDMCTDEKFADQPSLSYSCTGFLVAPDLLVTAGHCVYAVNTPGEVLKNETERACQSFLWFFDYQKRDDGGIRVRQLPAENLFRCKQIVYGIQNEKSPWLDYAVVQLDRPAVGRTPLKLAQTEVALGDTLSMIGYPYGTPIKLTDGGRVTRTDSNRSSFVTTLDAFQGNSGGPVFNAAGEVAGILIGGTPSLNTYTDSVKQCERYNVCKEDGTDCKAPDADPTIFPGFQKIGTDVQRIAPIRELLKTMSSKP
jgi:V8-like Glu-specific endopeptidase